MDPSGRTGPSKSQAAGPHWRRTTHGLYVPATTDSSIPEQRILEQAMRLPDNGAVTGWAACRLLGAGLLDGLARDGRTELPVPLALNRGGHIRGDARVLLNRDRLSEDDVIVRHGIRLTRAERATCDEVRLGTDGREGVVAIDMMAAARLTSLRRVRRYVEAHRHLAGAARVLCSLDLASEHSRSPNETRSRLIWVLDAGLPPPLVNRHVWTLEGTLLGIADLLDPVAGLAVEFDGADHREAMRHSHDVGREAAFRGVHLEVTRVTGPDLHDRRLVVERFLEARDRARFAAPHERRWTLDPPPGWPIPPSVDEVLDHADLIAELHGDPRHD